MALHIARSAFLWYAFCELKNTATKNLLEITAPSELAAAFYDRYGLYPALPPKGIRARFLEAAFYDRYGLYPAGPGALLVALEKIAARCDESLRAAWPELLHEQYERVYREVFAPHQLQVEVVVGGELCIGDCPVVPVDDNRNLAGLNNGVHLDEATSILMPTDPRHLVALAGDAAWQKNKVVDMSEVAVRRMNSAQCAQSNRFLYYRPASGLKAELANLFGVSTSAVRG
jgi:hypothetical protein